MSASYRNLNKIDEATEAIAEATKLLKGSGLEDRSAFRCHDVHTKDVRRFEGTLPNKKFLLCISCK